MLGDSDPSILYEETRHIFDDGGKGFAEADQRGEDRRKQSVALFNRQNWKEEISMKRQLLWLANVSLSCLPVRSVDRALTASRAVE